MSLQAVCAPIVPQEPQTPAPAQLACAGASVALTRVYRRGGHRGAPAASCPVPAQAACHDASAAPASACKTPWHSNVPQLVDTQRFRKMLCCVEASATLT